MRYRISEDAERDLDEIFVYWADRAGLEVADRITDRITERFWLLGEHPNAGRPADHIDRKSTRLNSSHGYISYAVFCLKKKKHQVIAACSLIKQPHSPTANSRPRLEDKSHLLDFSHARIFSHMHDCHKYADCTVNISLC